MVCELFFCCLPIHLQILIFILLRLAFFPRFFIGKFMQILYLSFHIVCNRETDEAHKFQLTPVAHFPVFPSLRSENFMSFGWTSFDSLNSLPCWTIIHEHGETPFSVLHCIHWISQSSSVIAGRVENVHLDRFREMKKRKWKLEHFFFFSMTICFALHPSGWSREGDENEKNNLWNYHWERVNA